MEFFEFMKESLNALSEEVPEAYEALVERLGTLSVDVEVDGACRTLSTTRGRITLAASTGYAPVLIRTRREIIRSLLDAERSFLDAALSDDAFVRGAPADVVVFHDALLTYVAGAVRSRTMPRLLDAYFSDEDLSEANPLAARRARSGHDQLPGSGR
jgi:hypothetical protein